MKKYIIIILSFLIICKSSFAQDKILKKDKSEFLVKVLEINDKEVKYKKWDNVDGPTYTTAKTEIIKIVYQNGTLDEFVKPVNNIPITKVQKKLPPIKNDPKPIFKKYTPELYEAERKKMYAEKKEAPLPDTLLYKYALMKVPNIPVYLPDKRKVKLFDYLSQPRFSNKPTLIITWAWSWCPPCLKMIDTLLFQYQNIRDKFNIVLLNRGEYIYQNNTYRFLGDSSIDKTKEFLLDGRLDYFSKSIILFDYDNEMYKYDKASTPLLFWADKDLSIRSTLLTFKISIENIKKVFEYTNELEFKNDHYVADFTIGENEILFPSPQVGSRIRIHRNLIGNNIIQLQLFKSGEATQFYTAYFTLDNNNNVFPFTETAIQSNKNHNNNQTVAKPSETSTVNQEKISDQTAVKQKQPEVDESTRLYNSFITSGDKFLNKNDLINAQKAYWNAAALKPNDEYVNNQLLKIDKAMEAEANKSDSSRKYDSLITVATEQFRNKSYDSAEAACIAALNINPQAVAPKEQLKDIRLIKDKIARDNKIKQEEELEIKFKNAVARGNKAVTDKNYPEALMAYKEALSVHKDDEWCLGRLKIVEHQMQISK